MPFTHPQSLTTSASDAIAESRYSAIIFSESIVKINLPDVQLRLLFPSSWHTIDSRLPSGGSSGVEYFPNLYPEDIPNYIRRNELLFDGKKWRYKTPHQKVFTPNGEYNFVVQRGQIYIVRQKFGLGSHIDIARGNNVDFAGQIRFGHNKSNKGQIKYWNNVSGHYKPSANSAINAGLPLNLFIPYQF